MAGLAGAALLVLGTPRQAAAHTVPQMPPAGSPEAMQLPKGVRARDVRRSASRIRGIREVFIQEITFDPGSRTRMTMPNDMVCEMISGSLAIKQPGESFTASKGHLWTCRKGEWEETINQSDKAAVMWVTHLRG